MEARSRPVSVGDVLDYYSQEVIPTLAAALTVDDKFPKEVLNELRNSYTHLARAHALSGQSEEEAGRELEASMRHLRRTCVDCIKVCILVTAQRCEIAIDALTTDLQLPDSVYTRISGYRARRAELSAHEGQFKTQEVIEELKALYNDLDVFYKELDDQFAGATAAERKQARDKRRAGERQELENTFQRQLEGERKVFKRELKIERWKSASIGAAVGAVIGFLVHLGGSYAYEEYVKPVLHGPGTTSGEAQR